MFVDRKQVAKLDELELESRRPEIIAALAERLKESPSMTFDIDDMPAKTAVDALRLFAGQRVVYIAVLPPDELSAVPKL